MTLDTPHGPNTKFFKKMFEKCGKNEGGNFFFPTLVFDSKLDHNSGLHAKKSERNLQ